MAGAAQLLPLALALPTPEVKDPLSAAFSDSKQLHCQIPGHRLHPEPTSLAGWDCADSMVSEEQPCSKQDRQIFFCSTAFPVQGRQTEAWEQTAEVYSAEQQLQFLSEMY